MPSPNFWRKKEFLQKTKKFFFPSLHKNQEFTKKLPYVPWIIATVPHTRFEPTPIPYFGQDFRMFIPSKMVLSSKRVYFYLGITNRISKNGVGTKELE